MRKKMGFSQSPDIGGAPGMHGPIYANGRTVLLPQGLGIRLNTRVINLRPQIVLIITRMIRLPDF